MEAAAHPTETELARTIAGAPPTVRKYAGVGMLPQAGLALSLAVLFARQFPSLGDEAAALIFGVVTLNEFVCPVLYRFVLVRSGEAFRKADSDVQPIPAFEETPAVASAGGGAEPA